MRHFRLSVTLLVLCFAGCEAMSPNGATPRAQVLSAELFSGVGDAETTARAFLSERAGGFRLDDPALSLELTTTREGLAGTYLRFGQHQQVGAERLPVFGGEVIVLVKDEGSRRVVRAVNLEHLEAARGVLNEGDVGAAAAVERALGHLGVPGPASGKPVRGVHVSSDGRARLAWEVKVSTESPPHDWTLFVDAATGEVLRQRDGVRFVDGTAYVFDMNPVASTGNTSLTDGSDATTPTLEGARFLVTLPRLDGTGFTSGLYANVFTRTMSARASSPTLDFLFTRDNLGFEQANVYFHLDRTQARLQALGFTNVNARPQEAVVDGQNADNSYYSPSNRRLQFGRGGVDDAEDGDIITHEYGHAVQDNQVPGFGDGDEGAMGEGFGDYLAASFGLTLATDAGHPQRSDPACVGDWDGVSYSNDTPKCLRRVDEDKHFPEDVTDEVHDDGELWSATLWDLRGRLGADVVDRLVVESHFLLGTASTFFTAGEALITADQNLFMGQHVELIRRRLIHHGLSRQLSPPLLLGTASIIPVAISPRRDSNGLYPSRADETKTLSVPGAKGLRLHFTRVELETHASCFQMGCDNVYLTNGEGDLFQVLSGTATDVTSVAVVGDTVNVRLVSDPSQNRYGYFIDRLEVLDAPPDAGLVFDGGMDVPVRPDAGLPMDAGAPPLPMDGGVVVDGGVSTLVFEAAGNESLAPGLQRGCGCGATEGLMAVWALLALRPWRKRTG